MITNEKWKLVVPPPERKIIGCKWTFKAKYNFKGEIEKYKARLAAKGFPQKFGCDYNKTFAPVVTNTAIRSFLAAAEHKNLKIKHIDMKTAFLHGDLKETIYMEQPEGYIKPGYEQKVCKLNKAIYGLKQAARAFNIKIGESLNKLNFEQSEADPCLFKLKEGKEKAYIIIYVYDMLIAGNEHMIEKIVKQLRKEYELKDLGKVTYYLGINVEKTKNGTYLLHQQNKIHELINIFELSEAKPTYTPMEPGYLNIDQNEKLLQNNIKFRKATGYYYTLLLSLDRTSPKQSIYLVGKMKNPPKQIGKL